MKSKSSVREYCLKRNQDRLSIIDAIQFETKSLYGRSFLNQKPSLKQDRENLLHLGCGLNRLEDWINADFFQDFQFWNKRNDRPDWMLDLRFPLNCDDNVWDGVFSEHTLEHLYPNNVLELLKELNRTMKPNSWLRISVPDLEKYIDYYKGQSVCEEFSLKRPSGCESIAYLTQSFGHLSVWDGKLLKSFLQEAGFTNIQQVSFKKGNNQKLLEDRQEREWESLYMECQKPGN